MTESILLGPQVWHKVTIWPVMNHFSAGLKSFIGTPGLMPRGVDNAVILASKISRGSQLELLRTPPKQQTSDCDFYWNSSSYSNTSAPFSGFLSKGDMPEGETILLCLFSKFLLTKSLTVDKSNILKISLEVFQVSKINQNQIRF